MSNLLKSKFLLGTLVVAVMVLGGVAVKATTVSAADCSITMTLKMGSTGAEVVCLQKSLGGLTADGAFGPMTKAAVVHWQSISGLTADGVFGPLSRAVWMANAGNSMNFPSGCVSATGFSTTTGMACSGGMSNLPAGCSTTAGFSPTTGMACNVVSTLPAGCSTTAGFSPTTGMSCSATTTSDGTLVGGAGSVDTYALTSNLSNETVGEGQSDVKVLGLEITPSDSSDLSISAMKLVFTQGSATAKFLKYADNVTIWYGSTKLASVDSSDFTSGNDYTQTVSFTKGAVIKAGMKGTIYVAVSGAGTIDSTLWGDTWTLDIASVRWTDGQGALISEDPFSTGGTRTMTFDSASSGTDTALEISSGDTSITDSHVVKVDATSDTNAVSIASWKMKVKGTSDVYLDSLPVNLTVTGAGNVDDVISGGLELFMDGASIGSADLSSDCLEDGDCVGVGPTETYEFTSLGTTMAPGNHTFTVKADVLSIADALDEGDTILATFGETQTDLGNFDATIGSDGNGDSLADGDVTGTATGEAIAFYSIGITVELNGTPTATVVGGSSTGDIDTATYTIKYDVTAFGSDIWVDGTTTPDMDGTYANGSGNDYEVTVAGSATTNAVAAALTSNATSDSNTTWKVLEGQTKTFTLTITATGGNAANEFDLAQLYSIGWDTSAIRATTHAYTFNLKDFKAGPVFVQTH